MAYGGVTPISPCAFMVTAGSCWTGARAGAWKARGAATRKAMIRDWERINLRLSEYRRSAALVGQVFTHYGGRPR